MAAVAVPALYVVLGRNSGALSKAAAFSFEEGADADAAGTAAGADVLAEGLYSDALSFSAANPVAEGEPEELARWDGTNGALDLNAARLDPEAEAPELLALLGL